MRSIVHEAALRYAELGYAVFPCAPGEKLPATPNGLKDASTDPEQIDRWWTESPAANVGIATEGLFVLDIDVEADWLNGDAERERNLAIAPLAFTPSGGRHYVFRQPEGRHWRNSASLIAPHVDTRADGGLFVAPPSALPGGKAYRWVEGCQLDVPPEQLPEPPGWLIEILDGRATSTPSSPRVADTSTPGNAIPDGQRNATLARLAGTMRRVGMTQAEIQVALLKANVDRCHPPLAPREVQRIAESIGRYEPDQISVAVVENHWEQLASGETPTESKYSWLTSEELDTGNYDLEYLVEGILVSGQPAVIAGPKKSLKTNISVDLALALGHGGKFLNNFYVNRAVRVGVMSGESGAATLQETARRIAWSKQWSLNNFAGVIWSFQVPQLKETDHIADLHRCIVENELEVLILDPTYLMMLGLGQDANNLFVVGSYLKSIGDIAQQTGCTPILCHHLRKGLTEPFEPAELDDIAWAGFQEFMRQWILLNRRVKYDPDHGGHHELWMSVGGSAGHSGLWGVNVDEGTRQDEKGRRWEVKVISSGAAYTGRVDAERDAKERRQEQTRQEKEQKHRKLVLEALGKFPAGETKRKLRMVSKLNAANLDTMIDELLEEGLIEVCSIEKSGRKFDGYRLLTGSAGQVGQTGSNAVDPEDRR